MNFKIYKLILKTLTKMNSRLKLKLSFEFLRVLTNYIIAVLVTLFEIIYLYILGGLTNQTFRMMYMFTVFAVIRSLLNIILKRKALHYPSSIFGKCFHVSNLQYFAYIIMITYIENPIFQIFDINIYFCDIFLPVFMAFYTTEKPRKDTTEKPKYTTEKPKKD